MASGEQTTAVQIPSETDHKRHSQRKHRKQLKEQLVTTCIEFESRLTAPQQAIISGAECAIGVDSHRHQSDKQLDTEVDISLDCFFSKQELISSKTESVGKCDPTTSSVLLIQDIEEVRYDDQKRYR